MCSNLQEVELSSLSHLEEFHKMKKSHLKKIVAWLLVQANHDNSIRKNMEKPNKSFDGLHEYIMYRAKEFAKNDAYGDERSCVQIDDEDVYYWAVHYYEEDETELDREKKERVEKQKAKKVQEVQISEEQKVINRIKEKVKKKEQLTEDEAKILMDSAKSNKSTARKDDVIDGQLGLEV